MDYKYPGKSNDMIEGFKLQICHFIHDCKYNCNYYLVYGRITNSIDEHRPTTLDLAMITFNERISTVEVLNKAFWLKMKPM